MSEIAKRELWPPPTWRYRRLLAELAAAEVYDRAEEHRRTARQADRAQYGADLTERCAVELQHLRQRLARQCTGLADELDAADLIAAYRAGLLRLVDQHMRRW